MGIPEAQNVIKRLLNSDGLTVASDFLNDQLLPDLCGSDGVPPVHLQIVCSALRDHAASLPTTTVDASVYETLGGAGRILSAHLAGVLSAERYKHDKPVAQCLLA